MDKENQSNGYKQFLNLNAKITTDKGYVYFGEVTDVGDDYLILMFKGTRPTLIKFSTIDKIVCW